MKEYEVNQYKKNCFRFKKPVSEKEYEVEVFLMKSPEEQSGISLIKTDKSDFTVEINELDYRPYFLIKTDSGEKYIIAERTLPVDGMNNFRDMGGYKTADGKHVKWGKLYRSDHIYNATDNGIEYLKKLNINTIIDYRSDNEITKYPNEVINNEVKTYCLDPSAHAAELAAQFQSSKENEDIIDSKLICQILENGSAKPRFSGYEEAIALADSKISNLSQGDDIENALRILQRQMSKYLLQERGKE